MSEWTDEDFTDNKWRKKLFCTHKVSQFKHQDLIDRHPKFTKECGQQLKVVESHGRFEQTYECPDCHTKYNWEIGLFAALLFAEGHFDKAWWYVTQSDWSPGCSLVEV